MSSTLTTILAWSLLTQPYYFNIDQSNNTKYKPHSNNEKKAKAIYLEIIGCAIFATQMR